MKIHMTLSPLRALALGALIALECFGQGPQSAQSSVSAGIAVTVHDPSGASVPGVQLTIHSLINDKSLNATSDATGECKIDGLIPGSYEIVATKYGFSEARSRIVVAGARRQLHIDLKLKLAAVDEAAGSSTDALKLDAAMKELQAMEARVQQLEAERPANNSAEQRPPADPKPAEQAPVQNTGLIPRGPLVATLERDQIPVAPGALPPPDLSRTVATTAGPSASPQQAALPPSAPAAGAASAPQNTAPAAAAVDVQTPFAYADFTWMNGTPRNKDVALDSPFFTPEIRFDTNFINDFNQPKDHTMGGSTEEFRNGEFQVEDIGIGGDFHWQNVRGRIMFMDGLFAVTTPRNDASSATGNGPGNTGGVGQWDLQNAYKYVSEAYGGYHFNVQHGLNVDAGIFVSYVGLFSYYNFDNWTYQPSYVSSNTPWFFNGVRIQWFPTNKLKIEPWIINGWQSYAKYNSHLGLGGQLLWEPKEWFKLVANQYGFGEDNLGLPKTQRIHTDDSIEVRYYNKPENRRPR